MASPPLRWRPPQTPPDASVVSPSLLATWSSCRLRATFQRAPATAGLRKMGLRAAVGTVAHAMLEQRFRSQEAFASAWAAESERTYQKLRRVWAPAVPPRPCNWPGWALTKHQVAKRVVRDLRCELSGYSRTRERTQASLTTESADRLPTLPWRERWLEDGDRKLAGRPDLVDRIDGVLTVVDYKTGARDLTNERRDQLLFYAALVQATLGELPVRGEMWRTDGATQGFHIASAAVDDVVRRALLVRDEMNLTSGAQLESKANPGPDTCPYCPFRVACRPFIRAYRSDWVCGQVAVGRVAGVGRLGSQQYVDLEVLAPRWRPKRLRVIGVPQDAPSLGDTWALSDFEGVSETAFFRWNTLTWTWPA
ncbi:RecB family exonuclease [Kribbella speibonae]|nr:PD-(D/E)XK nuclease family protein [Kribbella speibonae]